MAGENKVQIVIEVDTARGTAAVRGFEDSLNRLTNKVKDSASGMDSAGKSAADLGRYMEGLGGRLAGLEGPLGLVSRVVRDLFNLMTSGPGLIAGVAVGLAALGLHAANVGDEMHRLSLQSGLSVEQLSALRLAAAQADISIQDVANAMRFFNRAQGQLQQGSKEMAQLFADLGIKAGTDLKTSLEQAARGIISLNSDADRTLATMRLFGRGGVQMTEFLKDLATKGFDAVAAEARELGLVMSTETAKAGDKLNDDLAALRLTLEGISSNVGRLVVPALNSLALMLLDVVKGIRDAINGIGPLVDRLKESTIAVDAFKGAMLALGSAAIIASLGTLVKALGAVSAAALALAANPVVLTILGIAAAGAAVGMAVGAAMPSTEERIRQQMDRLDSLKKQLAELEVRAQAGLSDAAKARVSEAKAALEDQIANIQKGLEVLKGVTQTVETYRNRAERDEAGMARGGVSPGGSRALTPPGLVDAQIAAQVAAIKQAEAAKVAAIEQTAEVTKQTLQSNAGLEESLFKQGQAIVEQVEAAKRTAIQETRRAEVDAATQKYDAAVDAANRTYQVTVGRLKEQGVDLSKSVDAYKAEEDRKLAIKTAADTRTLAVSKATTTEELQLAAQQRAVDERLFQESLTRIDRRTAAEIGAAEAARTAREQQLDAEVAAVKLAGDAEIAGFSEAERQIAALRVAASLQADEDIRRSAELRIERVRTEETKAGQLTEKGQLEIQKITTETDKAMAESAKQRAQIVIDAMERQIAEAKKLGDQEREALTTMAKGFTDQQVALLDQATYREVQKTQHDIELVRDFLRIMGDDWAHAEALKTLISQKESENRIRQTRTDADRMREQALKEVEEWAKVQEERASAAARANDAIMRGLLGLAEQAYQGAQSFGEAWRTGLQLFELSFVNAGLKATDTMQLLLKDGQEVARGLMDAFTETFFDVFTGQFDKILDVWKSFLDMLIKMLAEFLAALVVRKFIEFIAGTFGLEISSGGGGGINLSGGGGGGGGGSSVASQGASVVVSTAASAAIKWAAGQAVTYFSGGAAAGATQASGVALGSGTTAGTAVGGSGAAGVGAGAGAGAGAGVGAGAGAGAAAVVEPGAGAAGTFAAGSAGGSAGAAGGGAAIGGAAAVGLIAAVIVASIINNIVNRPNPFTYAVQTIPGGVQAAQQQIATAEATGHIEKLPEIIKEMGTSAQFLEGMKKQGLFDEGGKFTEKAIKEFHKVWGEQADAVMDMISRTPAMLDQAMAKSAAALTTAQFAIDMGTKQVNQETGETIHNYSQQFEIVKEIAAKHGDEVQLLDTGNLLIQNQATGYSAVLDVSGKLVEKLDEGHNRVTDMATGVSAIVDSSASWGDQLSAVNSGLGAAAGYSQEIYGTTALQNRETGEIVDATNQLNNGLSMTVEQLTSAAVAAGNVAGAIDAIPTQVDVTVTTHDGRSRGGLVYAAGGAVPGAGDGDTVPAMLTPGEYIVNARATRRFRPILEYINSFHGGGFVPGYQAGGLINPAAAPDVMLQQIAFVQAWLEAIRQLGVQLAMLARNAQFLDATLKIGGTQLATFDYQIGLLKQTLATETDPKKVLQEAQALQQAIVARYQLEIQLVRARYDFERQEAQKTAQARLDALNKERDSLQKQLQAAQAWGSVVTSVEETIRGLTRGFGPTNPSTQYADATARLQEAFAKFEAAPTPQLAQTVQSLAQDVLQTAEQFYARPSPAFQALFAQITSMLQHVGEVAKEQAGPVTADDLEAQINVLNTTIAAEEQKLRDKLDEIQQREDAEIKPLLEQEATALATLHEDLTKLLQGILGPAAPAETASHKFQQAAAAILQHPEAQSSIARAFQAAGLQLPTLEQLQRVASGDIRLDDATAIRYLEALVRAGLIPSYQDGGEHRQTGFAYLHAGERVLPPGTPPVVIQIGKLHVGGDDPRRAAREFIDEVERNIREGGRLRVAVQRAVRGA